MANVKITDMSADASVTGAEEFPVSDGGSAKKVTVTQVKNFTIDQIEAISAGTAVDGNDQIYILDNTDSALKPVDIDTVLQHIADTMWGKAKEASPDGADELILKDGGTTEKTITFAVFAEYVRGAIQAAILDVSDLDDGSGALADANFLLITQGTTGKQCTLADIVTYVQGKFATYVTGLGAIGAAADADEMYILDSGTPQKITMTVLWAYITSKIQGVSDTGVPVDADILMVQDSGASNALAEVTLANLWEWIQDKVQGLGSKALPLDADILTIQDTADSDILKELTFTNVWNWIEDTFQGLAAKTTPVAGDILTIQDSEASDALKELTLANLKTHLETVGTYKELWIPANLWSPAQTTAPCAALAVHEYTANDVSMAYLAFDGAAQNQYAYTQLVMPPDWDRSTIKAKMFWSPGHSNANVDEYIGFELKGGALADDDGIDTALGSAVTLTDQAIADEDMHITAASSALTIAGAPALGELINLQLMRDWDYSGAGAAMDVDAWFFGLLIQYQATNTVVAW